MDKLTKWQTGMDQAYEAALEAADLARLGTEALEDEILSDEELFDRLAIQFARSTIKSGYPVKMTFLEYGVEQLRRERTPEHQGGWKVLRRWQLDGKGGVECKEMDEPTPNVSSWQRAQRGE